MGVSRQTVIDWENGKRDMRAPYLYLFCQITGFSEDDILLPIKST
jgi:transcriptional regulator with XRE-family HTH domain